MPQPLSGELSVEEREQAFAWIRDRWGDRPKACPISGPTTWTIQPHFAAPPVYGSGGSFFLGGTTYPYVMVACNDCGYTMFVSAVKMGLVPRTKPADAKTEAEAGVPGNG